MKRINFETAKLLHQVDSSVSSEAGYFDTYEEALEEGLTQALKIVIDAK